MALGDRAGAVFPKEFYMPRVQCVQVRHFCIWRQLAPPPRPHSRPTWCTSGQPTMHEWPSHLAYTLGHPKCVLSTSWSHVTTTARVLSTSWLSATTTPKQGSHVHTWAPWPGHHVYTLGHPKCVLSTSWLSVTTTARPPGVHTWTP